MLSNPNISRFICPALAVVATLVALFAPWFTRTTQVTQRTLDATLLEVIQGNSFVEYTSTRWLWISGVGVLLVIASMLVGDELRKRIVQAGSYLMVVLPGWSLLQVLVGDDGIDAGWGMWMVAVFAIAIVILARLMLNPEQAEPVMTQPVQQQ